MCAPDQSPSECYPTLTGPINTVRWVAVVAVSEPFCRTFPSDFHVEDFAKLLLRPPPPPPGCAGSSTDRREVCHSVAVSRPRLDLGDCGGSFREQTSVWASAAGGELCL
jgi:hypothetical protein